MFQRANSFDMFLIEYDDDRSRSLEPLRHLPDDEVVVLGLVSSKWQTLEDPEKVLRGRIDQAAQVPSQGKLGPDHPVRVCLRGKTAEEHLMSDEVQSAKLKLVAGVAHAVWGGN